MMATGWTPEQVDDLDIEDLNEILAQRAVKLYELTDDASVLPAGWLA